MKVIRASEMGMCFGVRDALQVAAEVEDPSQVTIHGELVHNSVVRERLAAAGFHQSDELDRVAPIQTPIVMITAHGISHVEKQRLKNGVGETKSRELIDTTCPLVRRVHDAANEMESGGRLVLLIGKPGHVEVRGIVEDLKSSEVLSDVQCVREYSASRLGVICQTTMPTELVTSILDEVRRKNPHADIRFVDTVCHPTKRRQEAMAELVQTVDAVVVVGGHNSNNTRRLVDYCRSRSVPVTHVQNACEIDEAWFHDFEVVGLTAGTSTLDETIDQVQSKLESIAVFRPRPEVLK